MNKYFETAITEAKKAFNKKEIPVGCVIVCNGKIISKGHNTKQKNHCVTDHAEIIAINKAAKKLRDWRLQDCELYVTLEPCNMCKEVIRQSRIRTVYYLLESKFNNEDKKRVEYLKVDNNITSYQHLLQSFFKKKREK